MSRRALRATALERDAALQAEERRADARVAVRVARCDRDGHLTRQINPVRVQSRGTEFDSIENAASAGHESENDDDGTAHDEAS
jgi:hypothetical protein